MIKRIRISKEDEVALAAATSCTSAPIPAVSQPDYSAVIIEKPWGHEYSLVRSDASDAWLLSIKHGERTSMHCHPTKKTSIVLLGGECVVTTFKEKTVLQAGDGIVIDKGVFHSTTALSPSGISLLETETPVNKGDLVRLNDTYGRAGKSYEGGKYVRPRDPLAMPSFYEAKESAHRIPFAECVVSVHDVHTAAGLMSVLSDFSRGVLIVLEGGVCAANSSLLFSHADAFHAHELVAHGNGLSLTGGLKLLYVHTTL